MLSLCFNQSNELRSPFALTRVELCSPFTLYRSRTLLFQFMVYHLRRLQQQWYLCLQTAKWDLHLKSKSQCVIYHQLVTQTSLYNRLQHREPKGKANQYSKSSNQEFAELRTPLRNRNFSDSTYREPFAHPVKTLTTLDRYYVWFSAQYWCKCMDMSGILVHNISDCLQTAWDSIDWTKKRKTY